MFSFVFFIQIIVLAKLDSINALTRASLGSYFVEQMGDFSCKVLVTSLRSKRFGWQAPEKATYGNWELPLLFWYPSISLVGSFSGIAIIHVTFLNIILSNQKFLQ